MTHISGPDGFPRTLTSTGTRPCKADVGCRFAACWSDLYCPQLYSLSSQTVVCRVLLQELVYTLARDGDCSARQIAHRRRAVLFASATAAQFTLLRAISRCSQQLSGSVLPAMWRITARAP